MIKTDETLFQEHRAGDAAAMPELERRWRKHLLPYVAQRTSEPAGPMVDEIFGRLAAHTGELGYIRDTLYSVAHHWTGAKGDWLDGQCLLSLESPLEEVASDVATV